MKRYYSPWLWWVAVLLAVISPRTFAQATRTTILTNGPTANRLNLVVLSEGYRTNQLAQFLIDATNAVNALLATQPYQEYKGYFNAFAISVASTNSGSDHPLSGITNNTYFNSTYDSYGPGYSEILTIPPDNIYDTNYSHGRGKVDALLQALVPEYDLVMLLVNDPQYGGSGGSVLIRSLSVDAGEIGAHESGHTLAGLGDEYYDTPAPGFTPVEKPNVTSETNRNLIKWNAWIAGDTPVPTPADDPQYANAVGLFEGAEYQTTGWYRPQVDCKMNHLGVDFCDVCSEQIVKSIYALVRPIDAFNPASTNVTITSTQAVSFVVTTLQPTTHDLDVQWFTNGTAISSATNPTYLLLPQLFSNGNYTLQAQVRDTTELVRNDPANVLSNSVTWNLNVSVIPLQLTSPQWLSGGRFSFSVTGSGPQSFVIQASTNLANWISLATNSLVAGKYNFTNTDPNTFSYRFYRTAPPP